MKGLHSINTGGPRVAQVSQRGAANLLRIGAPDQFNLVRSRSQEFCLCAFCESAHTSCDTGRRPNRSIGWLETVIRSIGRLTCTRATNFDLEVDPNDNGIAGWHRLELETVTVATRRASSRQVRLAIFGHLQVAERASVVPVRLLTDVDSRHPCQPVNGGLRLIFARVWV
jgi:hypothetical protein